MTQYKILFVCLGNICRSPLADCIMKTLVAERGLSQQFYVESCGTGSWHVGEPAHEDSIAVAERHGIDLGYHRARQLAASDFKKFDLLVAMDRENLNTIKSRAKGASAKLIHLREFDSESAGDLDVPDPYYLPKDSFKTVFDIIHRSCSALLQNLEQELSK
ncbi:MAG: low molecular weight phosphotyrosine protein phosphatase [Bdellovibrionales bacterium]|nr:low molecular weight phosphotyrosine protein phosphatase [Bdellovibrionales bacterium]